MLCYVYILKCADSSFYTGFTLDLKRRLSDHQSGFNKATKYKRPAKLLFYCCFPNKKRALDFEKYLKSHSGRAFRNKHLISKPGLPGETK